jgi:hypothetical protein
MYFPEMLCTKEPQNTDKVQHKGGKAVNVGVITETATVTGTAGKDVDIVSIRQVQSLTP